MRSPRNKLTLAVAVSIAVHGLLFIKGEPAKPYLSERSIIHARLDKQNRELVQQQQAGQISQQQDDKISEASQPTEQIVEPVNEPTQPQLTEPVTAQPVLEETQPETKTENPPEPKPETVVSTESTADKKTTNAKAKKEPALEELTEDQIKPQQQQKNQISSDSRAQVEALEGSEDPTYTSYRKVLSQYLAQRLEAQPSLKGRVRLKIKLEYGSFATRVNIIESSGNANLDDWARKAALAANPYPKIPAEIGSTFEFSPTLQLGEKTP